MVFQIKEFGIYDVKEYDERILKLAQQILKKIDVEKIFIELHLCVTHKTQAETCFNFFKNVFELDTNNNKVYIFLCIVLHLRVANGFKNIFTGFKKYTFFDLFLV